MTDTPPKPSRRRWRWLLTTVMAVGCVLLVFNASRIDQQTDDWLTAAHTSTMHLTIVRKCIIPGLDKSRLAMALFGRREIGATVWSTQEADELLALPRCPVKLTVECSPDLTREQVQALCDRYGSSSIKLPRIMYYDAPPDETTPADSATQQ